MSRTKGEWKSSGNWIFIDCYDKMKIIVKTDEDCEQNKDNATFIAICGTVADQLDSQGIDGEKAIKRLPEIIIFLKSLYSLSGPITYGQLIRIDEIINQLKPESERAESELVAEAHRLVDYPGSEIEQRRKEK